MTFKEPYEEPVDISYIKDARGYTRVRNAEVKPYRRYELGLIAEGLVRNEPIPVVYYGQVRGFARPEPPDASSERLARELMVRPVWTTYRAADHIMRDVRKSQYLGTKFAGGKV